MGLNDWRRTIFVLAMVAVTIAVAGAVVRGRGAAEEKVSEGLYARKNLVAWCIVPFDAKKRTPAQRAEMLDRIGLHRYAYDWRAEHLPTFDQELGELEKHHVELTAVWFP